MAPKRPPAHRQASSKERTRRRSWPLTKAWSRTIQLRPTGLLHASRTRRSPHRPRRCGKGALDPVQFVSAFSPTCAIAPQRRRAADHGMTRSLLAFQFKQVGKRGARGSFDGCAGASVWRAAPFVNCRSQISQPVPFQDVYRVRLRDSYSPESARHLTVGSGPLIRIAPGSS